VLLFKKFGLDFNGKDAIGPKSNFNNFSINYGGLNGVLSRHNLMRC
jgi:hypothetical protein